MRSLSHYQLDRSNRLLADLRTEAKLQDLFTNLKIPAEEKRRRLLAVAEDGKVFWVQGLRISEPHKVKLGTQRVLRWAWQALPENSGLAPGFSAL